ncbi:amino acid adenylation domain-containing protein [Candidatus Albibeggiatoa sp. nov. NOAA]|uniref:amino acid adenylation domain-containing protein n=1 Tax=Candidatus Albibeggiatoa sp. nov. NOAA TaxID=3162724 RepID=UPI0032F3284B|nr:amino acid adenylation domain-containing protein [Thiotrichaceae bacterium]
MNIAEFLAELQAKDIKLWVENKKLRYNAPKGQFTAELRETIGQHKADIIHYLSNSQQDSHVQLEPISRDQSLQLSLAQQRLWFLDQLEGQTAAYNIPYAIRLHGQLDIVALKNSLLDIVQRHEILRTNFRLQDNQVIQIIHATSELNDFFEFLPTISPTNITQYLTEQAEKPFDLKSDSLIRVLLIKQDIDKYILFINMHHIISDGWSMDVLFNELTTLYGGYQEEADNSNLPALPIQYVDYAHWQRNWLQGNVLEQQLSYWKQALANTPLQLNLPFDYLRPAIQTYHGATQKIDFGAELSKNVLALSEKQQSTLFITLLTAFQILLYRHTGQTDIVVGTPIAGRTKTEIESLIGFFVNTLAIRTKLQSKDSFINVLQKVKQTALNAYSHQDIPFEHLVAELQPERSLSYTPIFQVMFVFHQNEPIKTPKFKDLKAESLPEVDIATSKFDLNFHVWIDKQQLHGKLYYNTDLFKPKTIEWILSHFNNLLESITANPDEKIAQLNILNPEDKTHKNSIRPSQLFTLFKPSDVNQSIVSRFKQYVNKHPYHTAVKTPIYTWSYQVLNQKSNQLAHYLLKTCGYQEQRVALLFEHDAPMLMGILGVLKTGKTYVPLHIEHPVERLHSIIEDAQACIIIAQNETLALAHKVSQGAWTIINIDDLQENNKDDPDIHVSPQTPAYLLYTSGSTGQPKGVIQSHRNVLFHVKNYTNSLHLSRHDRLSQFASYSFDAGMIDIFAALLNGATLYPINVKNTHLNDLARILVKNKVTVYHSTPTLFRHFMTHLAGNENLQHIRVLILGGESVKKQDVEFYKRYFSDNTIFINGLGQTESSFNLQYFIDKQTNIGKPTIPIGYPVEEVEVLLLDEEGNETGLYGEIAIKSPYVALGYWRKSLLTQSVFKPLKEEQSYIYRSGDIGRLTADGYYEFLGRNDFQVKLRGFRIELGEIETLLLQHNNVNEAAVILREDVPNDKRLVAYIVSHNLLPERIPYQISCLVEYDDVTFAMQTEDISENGVCLAGDLPATLESDMMIRLCLALPDDSQARWFKAKVAWKQEKQIGIQLILSSTEQDVLQKNVDYLIDKQGLLKVSQRTLNNALRDYLQSQLPNYMLPSAYVILDKLPLTASGKIDRLQLPAPQYQSMQDNYVAPHNETETELSKIWEKLLNVSPIGVHDNFFNLGGHSLLMITLLGEIERVFGKRLELTMLFQAPTIARLAQHLQGEFIQNLPPSIIPMQPKGSRIPFFCVAGAGGGVHWFNELAAELAPEQPFYALETMGLEPLTRYKNKNRSQAQAIEFVKVLRQVQPQGPYYIGGYSYGGIVAHEMACHLQSLGEKVGLLVFLDSWNPAASTPVHIQMLRWAKYVYRLPLKFKFLFLRTETKKFLRWVYKRFLLLFYGRQEVVKFRRMDANDWRYTPSYYKNESRVALFRSSGVSMTAPKDENYGWQELIDGEVEVHAMPGNHYEMLSQPNVQLLADELQAYLIEAQEVSKYN